MRQRWAILALLVVAVIVAGCLKPPPPPEGPPAPPAPPGGAPPANPPASPPASPSGTPPASPSSQPPAPGPSPSPSPAATPAAIPSPYNLFTSNVQVSVSGNTVTLVTNALPDHKSAYWPTSNPLYEPYNSQQFHRNPFDITAKTLTFKIPLTPTPEAGTHQQSQGGPMGIARNGVPFFNQYAAMGAPLDDEIGSFDQAKGHPQQQGMYHYHVEPTALTANASIGKAGFLGVLLDGYPVYGPTLPSGATATNADLDTYHGRTDASLPEYPNGTYNYRITAVDPYINGVGYYGKPGTVTAS